MRRPPLPFVAGAALAGLLCGAAALSARAEVRLGRDVVPTSQAIRLHMDADQTDYSGAVDIELSVAKATKLVQFHAREMTLDQIGRASCRERVFRVV